MTLRRDPSTPRVVVVGSGIAGLTVALHAVEGGCRVTLVTKDVLEHANTRFAQGGIAGVMFDDDRIEDHIRDTLVAGAGLSDPEAVRVLAEEGPGRIRELIALSQHRQMPCEGADRIAAEHLADVREKIAKLRKLEHELERIVAHCDGHSIEDCYVIRALSDHGMCGGEH